MANNPTDIELIRQVLHYDNARAFSVLMQRYSSQVYSSALRLIKDNDEAQEVAQLAFIQAYRKMDTWRGENFGAWVSIIANHIALRLLEKEKRRQTEPLDENTDLPTENYDEQKEERVQSLEKAVAQLPEQDRLIIKEHYYNNVPLAELAHRLNQTENNIKVRLFRIREKLKATLVNN